MSIKKKDKKVEEDMVMSVPPEASGGMPGGFHNVPANTPHMGEIFAPTKDTEGSGDNFNPRRKRKKRKRKTRTGTPGFILTFDQFFKGRKRKNK